MHYPTKADKATVLIKGYVLRCKSVTEEQKRNITNKINRKKDK